ncbi:MAG: hypothetical protein HYT87_13940 [Nitrospirae bacterium]|nr:hypothetical protein [Nitrospirota bacterium]
MRALAIAGLLALAGSAYAVDGRIAALLETSDGVRPAGKPWKIEFVSANMDSRELLVPEPNLPDLFRSVVGEFHINDSIGQRIEPYGLGQVLYRKMSGFHLLGPGQTYRRSMAVQEGWVYAGSQTQDVPCRNTEHCMEVGLLRLSADTYRLQWPLESMEKENPFKTMDERAKVWTGKVWSNTLIIQTTEKEPVKVGLDVDPDTLNFKSEGKWITAYLSAPQGADLVASQTKFQGTIAADSVKWEEGGGKWEAKFPRSLVIDLLKDIRGWELDGFMKVFVSTPSGDKMYWGDDKIRILEDPGNASPPSAPPASPQGPPSTPPGQDKKKSPRR